MSLTAMLVTDATVPPIWTGFEPSVGFVICFAHTATSAPAVATNAFAELVNAARVAPERVPSTSKAPTRGTMKVRPVTRRPLKITDVFQVMHAPDPPAYATAVPVPVWGVGGVVIAEAPV